MCDSPAFFLLQAMRSHRGIATTIDLEPDVSGERLWVAAARSPSGEIWRSRHRNLMLAVVMLEKMLANPAVRRHARLRPNGLRARDRSALR